MAGQFSKTDQRRITFLSLLSSAAHLVESPSDDDLAYGIANDWLKRMEEDGFFEEERAPARPTQLRSERSARPASRSQSSRNGSRGGDFKGFRNPDAPATEKQIAAAIRLGADYSEDELADFTMQEISDLMNDLKG